MSQPLPPITIQVQEIDARPSLSAEEYEAKLKAAEGKVCFMVKVTVGRIARRMPSLPVLESEKHSALAKILAEASRLAIEGLNEPQPTSTPEEKIDALERWLQVNQPATSPA